MLPKQNTVNLLYRRLSAGDVLSQEVEFEEVVHVLGFVHVPRSPPLALGVFMARHSLPVNLLALPLPAQVLLLLLLRRRHVQVQARLRGGEILKRTQRAGRRSSARKQPGGGDIRERRVRWTVMKCWR